MSFILVRRRWRASTQHRPLRLGLLRCRRHKGLCGGTEAHTYKRQLLLVKPLEKLFCWNQHEPKPKDYDLQGAITMTNFAHKTFYCVIPMSTVPTISEKWRWGWEHWQSGEMGRAVVVVAKVVVVVVVLQFNDCIECSFQSTSLNKHNLLELFQLLSLELSLRCRCCKSGKLSKKVETL